MENYFMNTQLAKFRLGKSTGHKALGLQQINCRGKKELVGEPTC